ncbi:PREDICTED: uncharacterized protein LOC108759149 [Trachymyrmex cornetzi]|uniref:uncharacterized protein LOC108759149 n=1 Tax=Trachymyrmex cornetzi TaxID=471704 RepID=UPI00084F1063|nr:PREDICTED: uncharacterized protein LOC108759149 [Trachymyrmex cornetzi]
MCRACTSGEFDVTNEEREKPPKKFENGEFEALLDEDDAQTEQQLADQLNDNSNIIFTKADKGNLTVALDKNIYLEKVKTMLDNKDTYMKIPKDPTSKINNNLRQLLAGWKKQNYISELTYKQLYCSDGNIPRAYALPKIHKLNCPFRIIISSLDSALYNLAAFLHGLIVKSIPKATSNIENSFELVQKLQNIKIDHGFTLVSLDMGRYLQEL